MKMMILEKQNQKQEQEPIDKQTELMKKYGPQETTYCVSWHKEDEKLIWRYFQKARTQKDNSPLIIEFMKQLENRYNDHPAFIIFYGKRLYIDKIAKTLDVPTIQGVQFMMRQIIVAGSTGGLAPWRYMAVGSDTREARAYQPGLYAELGTRCDMNSSGTITRINESLEFVANFASSFPTLTVRESAIWNASDNNGTNLNRNMFKEIPIVHTLNVAAFTVATNIN